MDIKDANPDAIVTFQRGDQPGELGKITSANERYVFVQYGEETRSKATLPEDLTLVGSEDA